MTDTPDLVILNGAVLTMDPSRPRAGGVALRGGHVLAVGSTAAMRDLAGPQTRVIDAQAGTVLPGFIDSHVHLFQGAAALDFLDLSGVEGHEALADAIRAYAQTRPDEPMIMGTGAAYGLLAGRNPDRHDLDAILADRPVALLTPDIHTVFANTRALETAGLLHGGTVPEGSTIVMGADGCATGELLETGAFGAVLKLSRTGGRDMLGYVTGADPEPPATAAERAADRALLQRGLAHAARHGVTTMHNMDGNFYQLELLSELDAAGALTSRVQVPFHLKNYDPLSRLDEAAEMQRRFATDFVWSGRVKMFIDGVLDTHTALMLRPYPDAPGTTGDAVFEAEHFNEACRRIDAMGLQISVHAIGDAAVRRTLDGFQAARAANGARDARHRVEHIELIDPADLPRFRDLGAVASVQPRHSCFGGFFPFFDEGTILHEDQRAYAFAWQRLRAAGARVTFSTDWPVVPIDVMANVQSAVAPLTPPGPGWDVRAVPLCDALAAYTAQNAWVEFNEARKGRLAPGMMGDVVVMDRDLEATAPAELGRARPVMTICGGRVIYEA